MSINSLLLTGTSTINRGRAAVLRGKLGYQRSELSSETVIPDPSNPERSQSLQQVHQDWHVTLLSAEQLSRLLQFPVQSAVCCWLLNPTDRSKGQKQAVVENERWWQWQRLMELTLLISTDLTQRKEFSQDVPWRRYVFLTHMKDVYSC